MTETLVLLYIDLYTGLKIPGLFVTINSKKEISYEIIFEEIRNIISLNGKFPLSLKTYTIDFEKSLEIALTKIFPNVKKLGVFITIYNA